MPGGSLSATGLIIDDDLWSGRANFASATYSTNENAGFAQISVIRLGGRIEAKEIDADGDPIVKLTTWARNQRGQECMPGTAVIALPQRA